MKKTGQSALIKRAIGTKKKAAAGKKKGGSWNHNHFIVFLFLITFLLCSFIAGTLYLYIVLDIPDIRSVKSYRPRLTSQIFDNKGRVADRVFVENRRLLPLAQMPALLPKAFIAAEDARFYQHAGVDIWSAFRAFAHNLRAGSTLQGGSTITQQVARSLLLSRKKVYSRKIKEAILAYRIDSLLSKDEIIYIYLNQIYLGEGAYGVGAAAETYFNKQAGELNLAEIAMLAGLPQAPGRYSPFKDLELVKKRQAYVLNRMAEEGFISPAAARAAFGQALYLASTGPAASGDDRYFIQHVRSYIEEKYGEEVLHSGGLKVYTTVDRTLQQLAAASVRRAVAGLAARQPAPAAEKTGIQAGLVAVEVGSGRVLAMVGGVNFADSQFNRAVQARRQPGSAIKPIIYAAALEKGFSPDSLIDDSPLQLPGSRPGEVWEPKNFDNEFHGPTTISEGLIHSRNIVTIRLLQKVGVPAAVSLAKSLGINSPLSGDLSLALGTSGVSLLELTGAYSAFADSGRYLAPLFISRIVDRDGRVLEENKPLARQAVSAGTAAMITGMLRGAVEKGTGTMAKGLGVPAAGKTGTTDKNTDAWFIGYTDKLAVGVWLGYDRNSSLGPGETGGRAAAPLWLDFMKAAR